ncbi:MAG: tetratricopeptide repeat protein [Deferribacterales bacterium]
MRYFLALIITFFLSSNLLATETEGSYVKEFLKASMLINDGNLKEALPILENLNKNINDETIVIKLAEVYIALGKNNDFKKLVTSSLKKEKFIKNSTLRRFYADTLARVYNNLDEAISVLKKGIEYDPSVENYTLLAKLCEQKKDFSCAILAYDKILEKDKNAENYYKRGLLYYQLELKGKAIADFEASLKLDKSFMPLIMIADIYIQDNKTDEAIKYLDEAIKLRPGFIIPEYRLAELYRIKGDFRKAIDLYEQIVDKVGDKEKVSITKQIAAIYFELKDYTKANLWFKKALDLSPNDTQTYYFLAVTSEFINDFESAMNYYKELTFRDPGMLFAKKRLAYSYLKLKQYDKGIETINSIDKNDQDVDAFRIKATIYQEMGKKDDQLKTLLEGFEKFPTSEEILFDLADYYEKVKHYDKVEFYIKKVLELNPKKPSALNYLGYLYADLNKNLEEAYKMISEALSHEPNNPAYLDSMAWVLYKLKRYQEAYDYQKKALKLLPNDKDINEHMKEIIKALGINKTIEEILNEN